jgi:hypothetical protein
MFKKLLVLTGLLFLVALGSTAQAFIAYNVPGPSTGNQSWTGSLGMDFDVNAPITVTSLGVYDSGQNGISGTLYVVIFNADTQVAVTSTLSFTGTQGTLIDGSRFQDLTTPVTLAPGHYSVVSWGSGQSHVKITLQGLSANRHGPRRL